MIVSIKRRTAAKEHKCISGEIIKKGDEYYCISQKVEGKFQVVKVSSPVYIRMTKYELRKGTPDKIDYAYYVKTLPLIQRVKHYFKKN